jgi:hypothetical protein
MLHCRVHKSLPFVPILNSVYTFPPYYHVLGVVWLTTGFGLVNAFIDHLYTRLGTTSNYSATANLHNSQITTALAIPFPAFCVFTSCSLATASNSGHSSASCAQVLSSQPPVQNTTLSLPCRTQLNSSLQLPWLWLLGTDHIENAVLLLLRSCPLLRERVCRAVAQKRVA